MNSFALSEDAQNLLFREAHTANTFSSDPVTEDDLRAIYDLIKWAPTGMNGQPLRMVALKSEAARARLIPHLMGANQEKTKTAPMTVLLAADTLFWKNLGRVAPHMKNPETMFDGSDANKEASLNTAKLSATLQVAYFLLGIRAAGFAAGPMGGFNRAAVDAEFFPDGTRKSLLVVNLGKPGPNAFYPRAARLEFDEIASVL